MTGHAERGMSVPPEVVFNTASDPHRASAWLPEPLRRRGARPETTELPGCVRWTTDDGWAATLRVRASAVGGAHAELDLDCGTSDGRLTDLAGRSLGDLAREAADNLTVG